MRKSNKKTKTNKETNKRKTDKKSMTYSVKKILKSGCLFWKKIILKGFGYSLQGLWIESNCESQGNIKSQNK